MEATPKMHIGGLAPWFGSKRTLAPRIVEAIGPHRAYWEPFCGSLAVLFAKPEATFETVNDLHGELINLARVVADEVSAVELYIRSSRVLMSEAFHAEAVARWVARVGWPSGAPSVGRALDFLVVSWMGRNGLAGTDSTRPGFAARYTANGGHPATRFSSAVESIPAWHSRLRRVLILNRDAFEVLGKIEDADGVAVYVDPPYIVKGARYAHDFAEGLADHARLAEALRRFKRTRVVVSYYAHEALEGLYPGWSTIDLSTTKNMSNASNRDGAGSTVAPEVLLVNKDTYK